MTPGVPIARMPVMTRALLAALVAVAACGTETTTFRTTDRTDADDHPGSAAAIYDVRLGAATAVVHVWSNGGYIGTSDDPMTHVGFEIRNTGSRPIVFDSDALELVLFDSQGARLPTARFTAVTPLGPARVPIAGHATVALDAYFRIPVRPRVVEQMRARWVLLAGNKHDVQYTSFVRDDSPIVTDPQFPPLVL
jgi:hypothetical protein